MRAVCIGGATVDAIATIESDRIERMSMLNAETSYLLLEEGRKTEALDMSTYCGGGAINAAVALARIGFDVGALVKLGRDDAADFILSRLAVEGIATRWVVRDGSAPTGASMIITSHEHNAAVFTFRGANALLQEADLPDAAFGADLVYAAGLSGQSANCLPAILAKAKSREALTCVTAGTRQLTAHADMILGALGSIDILAINRTEAEALVPFIAARIGFAASPPGITAGINAPPLLARGLAGAGREISLPTFLAALHTLGAPHVMITDGSRGAFVGSADGIVYCPAEETAVASTAGAGDAITATFAAFIALGYAPDVALKAATLNAASVIGYTDTQSGLLRREVLEARLAARADRKLRKWNF